VSFVFKNVLNALDHIYTFLAVKILWRNRNIRAEAIRGFQSVEADGVWHLYQVIPRIEDPKIRAQTFLHLIEEESHADEFARAYEAESGTYFKKKYIERRRLFDEASPVWKTLAYVHVGEVDATIRFQKILQYLEQGPFRSAIQRIVQDELGHVDLTYQELVKMGVPPAEVTGQVSGIRWQRFQEVWVNVGRSGGERISEAILGVIYFLFIPFVFLPARKRMEEKLVEVDNNHMKHFP